MPEEVPTPDVEPIPQRLNPTLTEFRTNFISGLKFPLFDLGRIRLDRSLGQMRRNEPDVTISSGARRRHSELLAWPAGRLAKTSSRN
jgi:hypothetical protein